MLPATFSQCGKVTSFAQLSFATHGANAAKRTTTCRIVIAVTRCVRALLGRAACSWSLGYSLVGAGCTPALATGAEHAAAVVSVPAAAENPEPAALAPSSLASAPLGTPSSFAPGAVDTSALRLLGRVDSSDPTRPRFAWQGAGLSMRVRGARIAVWLQNDGGDLVFFQPVLDGRPGARFGVSGAAPTRVRVVEELGPGEHTFELYRETEGQFGATTFLGLAEGELVGPTPAASRRIEVVGDSITAGYGNLGHELHRPGAPAIGCPFSAESSSWYATYAALAGRALGAEVTSIARSGWGVLPQSLPEANGGLPSVYMNALGVAAAPEWSFRQPVDVVVINLGTNDWSGGDPGRRFERAYVSFVRRIRQHHPHAWILLTIGSMLAPPERAQVERRLAAVVARRAAAADSKIAWFSLGTQDVLSTGCDWHPSAADHQRMALLLQAELRRRLGW